MRIAAITALFPPTVIGGAEVSASNLATKLAERGNDVRVLSTTARASQQKPIRETFRDVVSVYRHPMPRSYTAYDYAAHWQATKLVWHAQDHLDPRNRGIWADFIDEAKPDFALVHVAQGLGFNGLLELAKRDIPTIFVLHDLSLVCYKTSMFTNGKTCEGHCTPCRLSSRVKMRYVNAIPRVGFVSPSRSNYETVARYAPIGAYPSRVILNANPYPKPAIQKAPSSTLRLMYAGQISRTKGVEFLLQVVDQLVPRLDVSLRVVGGGPELERLRATYGDRPWVTFTGKVTQEDVSCHMAESDLLCTPSIWADNSPGVIIQAMTIGLPVLGSDMGGIPELVRNDVTGAILPAGDASAWSAMIEALCTDPSRLERWTRSTLEASSRFEPDASVDAYIDFMNVVREIRS